MWMHKWLFSQIHSSTEQRSNYDVQMQRSETRQYEYENGREKHILGVTYSGKTDSTPTPATNLRNLKVVAIPALRLAMTMPFNVDSRRLFSGTCCLYRESERQIYKWTALRRECIYLVLTTLIWTIHPGCTSGISLSVRTLSTASLFKIWEIRVMNMLSCLSDHCNLTGCDTPPGK
jgi:hypothetical protein